MTTTVNPREMAFDIIVLVVLGLAYFLPIVVALCRGHPNFGPIFIVNLFLGWMLVGWVVAMAWSVSAIADAGRGRSRFERRARYDDPEDDYFGRSWQVPQTAVEPLIRTKYMRD